MVCEIESQDGDTLILFQRKYDGEGTDLKKASVFHQLAAIIDYAKGLSLMHKANYVHMDAKPANILLQGDLNETVTPAKGKVSDFGMTCKKGSQIKGGSPAYLPPEVFSNGNFDSLSRVNDKIDSYSLGVTIYEIIMNWNIDKALFQLSDRELNTFFAKAKNSLNRSKEQTIKSAILDVAYALLHRNPNERISCEETVRRLTKIQKELS